MGHLIFFRSTFKIIRQTSDLPAGTGRVHPRRVAGTAGTGRRVFFSKSYPIRLIPMPVASTRVRVRVRVRGYSGTRAGGSGTRRISGSNVIMVY
jgi:hypothetical protein